MANTVLKSIPREGDPPPVDRDRSKIALDLVDPSRSTEIDSQSARARTCRSELGSRTKFVLAKDPPRILGDLKYEIRFGKGRIPPGLGSFLGTTGVLSDVSLVRLNYAADIDTVYLRANQGPVFYRLVFPFWHGYGTSRKPTRDEIFIFDIGGQRFTQGVNVTAAPCREKIPPCRISR
eukprot:1180858-Prorocentrum_minimum.AAC.3